MSPAVHDDRIEVGDVVPEEVVVHELVEVVQKMQQARQARAMPVRLARASVPRPEGQASAFF